MPQRIFEENESAVRSYCRSFPAVFGQARGARLFDEQGNAYIDFFAGAGALNYGHNHPYIKQEVLDYINSDGVSHALDMYTTAKAAFIESFRRDILDPKNLRYRLMFTGPTGTNAVEAALKLARKVKKRTNVLCLMGCFHGMTAGALALTTDRCAREGSGQPLNNVTHIPPPNMIGEKQGLEYLKMILTDDHSGVDKPCAFILETTQAEGGIHVMSDNYLQSVAKICREHDILLIIDDIQMGCARCGSFFSFERAGLDPDMVVLSKSISGYGFPMALLLLKEELDVWQPAEHNGTFRGNQLSFVAAAAALDVLKNESIENETLRKGALTEQFIDTQILPLSEGLVRRGIGLAQGIDFIEIDKSGALAKTVQDICFKNKLIIERVGRQNAVLKIMPPLTIEDEILMEGLHILHDAVKTALTG